MRLNNERVVYYVLEMMGGSERAFAAFEQEHARAIAAWDRDTVRCGFLFWRAIFPGAITRQTAL
jgi:hypothetical protein